MENARNIGTLIGEYQRVTTVNGSKPANDAIMVLCFENIFAKETGQPVESLRGHRKRNSEIFAVCTGRELSRAEILDNAVERLLGMLVDNSEQSSDARVSSWINSKHIGCVTSALLYVAELHRKESNEQYQ